MGELISRAVSTSFRFPALLVYAVLWGYAKALVFPGTGTWFNVTFENGSFAPPHQELNVLSIIGMLVSILFTAGYLFVWRRALTQEEPPSGEAFVNGISQLFGRIFGWNVIATIVLVLLGLIAIPLGFLGIFLLIGMLVAMIAFLLVEYIVAARDRELVDAIAESPRMVGRNFLTLLGIFLLMLLIGFVTGAVMVVMHPAGLLGLLLPPLVGGLFEAWLAGSLMALVLADKDY